MKLLGTALITCVVTLAGCITWVSVKPSEVPKVGNMTVGQVASGPQRGQAVAVSVARLERPDGTLVEIKGKPDVRITSNEEVFLFKHPIVATLQGEVVTIQSSNRAPTKFNLSSIQKVEVSNPNMFRTMLVTILGGLALGALLSVLLVFAL